MGHKRLLYAIHAVSMVIVVEVMRECPPEGRGTG